MNIGELAKRSGLTHSRIRFYESSGLLKMVERRPNGYRTYPPEAVLVLNLITTAQKAGFSLEEIRSLLPPDLTQWEHGALLESLRRKVKEIEALEARLAQSKAHLVTIIMQIETKPADLACSENARRVLSRLQHGEFESPAMAADDVKLLSKAKRRGAAGTDKAANPKSGTSLVREASPPSRPSPWPRRDSDRSPNGRRQPHTR